MNFISHQDAKLFATHVSTSNSHDWHISHTPYQTNLAIQINVLSDLLVISVCAMDSLIGSIDYTLHSNHITLIATDLTLITLQT